MKKWNWSDKQQAFKSESKFRETLSEIDEQRNSMARSMTEDTAGEPSIENGTKFVQRIALERKDPYENFQET